MANDFSGDSNCVAWWKFLSGALTTDSKGTNTFTNNNVVSSGTLMTSGLAAADFESVDGQYFSITNANLSSTFPLKISSTYKTFSIASRIQVESVPIRGFIVSIGWYGGFQVYIETNRTVVFSIGYNSDANAEVLYTSSAISLSNEYFICVTYNDTSKAWTFQIYDVTGAASFVNTSGTATNNVGSSTYNGFAMGRRADGNAYSYDGLIGETAIFIDVLTSGEIDAIRAGTYGAAGSTLLPISGSFDAVADILGSMAKKIQTTGLVDSVGSPAGSIGIKKLMVGSVFAEAGASGLISIKKTFSGDLACISDITADISVLRMLTGSFESTADISGSVIITEAYKIRLSGNISAMAAIESAINVKRNLTGQIYAIPSPDGRVVVRVNLTGSVDAIADAIGQIQSIGAGTLGLIIDPTIESVTIKKFLELMTVVRSSVSVTTYRSIESI